MANASDLQTQRAGHPRPGAWVGYAACACAWLFAIPSFYWAGGGKVGTDTVGQAAVESSWSTDPLFMTVVLVTALLKVLAGLLSLALVRLPGGRVPRWMMLTVGWAAAGLLTLYGGGQFTTQILIKTGTIQVPQDFDWHAFSWHLYLWSPWFLTWGVLMAMTAWHYQKRSEQQHQDQENRCQHRVLHQRPDRRFEPADGRSPCLPSTRRHDPPVQ
jgi:hypothetical protein